METHITSMKKTEDPIVVEQLYEASPEEVWAAITERDRMIRWFFDNIPAFEPRVGFETTFNIHNDGRDFPHCWRLTEVVPHKRITCHWSFANYPGESLVTFELFEQDDKTGIILTSKVIEDFPDGIVEFTRESGEQGWRYFIQDRLQAYFNG